MYKHYHKKNHNDQRSILKYQNSYKQQHIVHPTGPINNKCSYKKASNMFGHGIGSGHVCIHITIKIFD